MKRYSILLFNILLSLNILSQNYLSGPEDIVYDFQYNRYLVVNASNSTIIQIDSCGIQSSFQRGVPVPLGAFIQDSIIYVSTNYPMEIKGYRLSNRTVAHRIPILSATALAGICGDDNGFLYVVDQAGKIYKVDLKSNSANIFVNTGLPQGSQGVCYDPVNQRLIIVSYPDNSSILAVNLLDTSVVTLTTTSIGRFLKIISDGNHNYYVSSWRTNSIYKFNSDFSEPPVVISENHDKPTGMCINKNKDQMYVVNYGSNSIDSIYMNFSKIDNPQDILPKDFTLLQNYPNPFNPHTTIEYSLESGGDVKLDVYDLSGKLTSTLVREKQNPGRYEISFNGVNYPSGIYFYKLNVNGRTDTNRMLLIK